MMETLELKGKESLLYDIEKWLRNGRHTDVKETTVGDSTFRVYIYECGKIQVPTSQFENRRITHTTFGTKSPEWFKELVRSVKVIWDDALIKERHKGLMERMTREKYVQKKYLKIELTKLFETYDWVVPYYIYWELKTNWEVFAVLDYTERTPFVVPLEQTMRDVVLRLLQDDGFNLSLVTQQIVQMKRGDNT